VFGLQKYQISKQATSYFELTNQLRQSYISPRLQELCGYYSNCLSYEEVAFLVERVSGERLLSDKKIGQIVSTKALELSQQIYRDTITTLGKIDRQVVKVNQEIDIYRAESKEILLFDDGTQVKSQKAQRQSKAKPEKVGKSLEHTLVKTSAITSDIVLLQKATGGFEYITTPINATGENLISLTSIVQASVIQEYGGENKPLNLVAITDGARTIRHRLNSIFGSVAFLILDWYHLCKKLRLLMSMIAINQADKKIHLKFLLSQLWHGKVTTVLEYLKTQVTARIEISCRN